MPHARLEVMEGVGHCPMLEHVAEFSALVGEFSDEPSTVGIVSAFGD
jgi:pimeloyl-ACP methyl ester carboxylesterase